MELAGLRTSTISFDATAITVETSLQQLSPKFENVTVSRSGVTSEGGYHWTVTFNNIVGNLLVMEADFTRLEGWDSKIIVVQRDAGSEKLRGSFKLQFSNHVTSSVPFNANAIALKKAIEDLPNVGSISVARVEISSTNYFGFEWTVTFTSVSSPSNIGAQDFFRIDEQQLIGSGLVTEVTKIREGRDRKSVV